MTRAALEWGESALTQLATMEIATNETASAPASTHDGEES
jgi:hypothetical protein